jgi:hypothetical protein
MDMFSNGRVIVDTNMLSTSQVCRRQARSATDNQHFLYADVLQLCAQASSAVLALKALMMEHFDELDLVSSAWDNVILAVSDRFAVAKHGNLDLLSAPHDTDIEGLMGFLRKSGPLRTYGSGRE